MLESEGGGSWMGERRLWEDGGGLGPKDGLEV